MRDRESERTRLVFHLRVFEGRNRRFLGQLADITTKGLMLITENPIPTDRRFSLTMDLPKHDTGRLSISALSKWCRRDKAGEFYRSGFALEEIPAADLALVRRLVRDFYQNGEEINPVEDMNPPV
jgi:hypothetical protein